MKKFTVVLALVFAAVGSVYAAGFASPPSGLVSWWPGEGNANDIVSGNNGVLMNGMSFTNGEVGMAFNLNGINNYLLINPTTSNLDVGRGADSHFEGWFKPTTVATETPDSRL